MGDDLPRRAWLFLQDPEEGSPPVVEVEPIEEEDFTLNELQGFVGGLIERIPIPGHIIWANEESGMYEEFETNSRFCGAFLDLLYANVLMGPKLIAGNVLVMDTPALRANEEVMGCIRQWSGVA